jgi:hypothetical protein
MVKYQELLLAMDEAERFLLRAEALRRAHLHIPDAGPKDFARISNHPVEQAAVRRASMDLTRALAALRKY